VFLVLAGAKDFGFQGPWSFFKSKQPPDITPTILGLKMIKVNKKVHATYDKNTKALHQKIKVPNSNDETKNRNQSHC
jgi:hypothetical protein